MSKSKLSIGVCSGRQMNGFGNWLAQRGAEMLAITSQYEKYRFRCAHGVGVLYKSGGASHQFVIDAYDCYASSKTWDGKPKTHVRTKKRSQKDKCIDQLIERDGADCFFCGLPLNDDITIEHLLSIVHGGTDRIENKALAHGLCNKEADILSVAGKVALRDSKRAA